ncbi:MAG: hypothetical protein WCW13_03860 [archaeon]|jgi:hypothetical protein
MNKTGFGGILLILAIALTATMLLTINNETKFDNTYKENIPQAAITANNYELILTQISQNCKWQLACIDENASVLTNSLNSQNNLTCALLPAENDLTAIKIKLSCYALRNDIRLDIAKTITIPITP